MKGLLISFVVLFAGCNSQPSQSYLEKAAIPIIDSFFVGLRKNDVSNSLVQLLTSNPNISLNDSITQDLKNKFILINETAGTYMGERLVKKRLLENDIAVYSYLVKYDRKFYRFIFMFYNNGKTVKLYKFLFDDDIDMELEGSLKFYVN